MARRLELGMQVIKGDGRGAKSRGSLDADIIIANAPDPVFVSDLEGSRSPIPGRGFPPGSSRGSSIRT